jgi:phenylpropionate dioxygenase-like ring-hydroxylating dioxygenase large terminal subunit
MEDVNHPEATEELPDGYYGRNFGRVPTGKPCTPLMEYAKMLEADPGEIPPATIFPGNHNPKPRRISYDRYYDPEIAKLEDEHIWSKMWLCAGREEDIPNVGDRMVFEIRDKSYLVVRSAPNEIRAFHNSCRHRGRLLCEGSGTGEHIRCPFHAWSYNLDGSIAWIPVEDDFPLKERKGLSLVPVQTGTWGGNVFINADPKAPPLEKALGVLIDLFKDFDLGERYTVTHLRQKVRANWKVVQEAFQEGYHVIETHWDSLAIFGDTTTTYDCWEDEYSHIGRLITPTGIASGFMADKVSVRDSVEQYVKLYNGKEADPGRGETIEDARNYLAELKREQLEAERGMPVENATNARLLDFVKYFMFPNFHPWWGEQFPITYRFIPLGTNPEEALLEIRLLAPVPKDGPRPASAKPVYVDFDEKCADFPELGFIGYIADQDVANMPQVQKGMRAARPDKATPILGMYQEKQITHFHEKLDKLLGLKKRG